MDPSHKIQKAPLQKHETISVDYSGSLADSDDYSELDTIDEYYRQSKARQRVNTLLRSVNRANALSVVSSVANVSDVSGAVASTVTN